VVRVLADAARALARAQADRGALPDAVAILRRARDRIDATDGYVRDDGSLLAELPEQLEDEIANFERKSSDVERMHQRKGSQAYRTATPGYAHDKPRARAWPGCSGSPARSRACGST
jgi:hypothetical protein